MSPTFLANLLLLLAASVVAHPARSSDWQTASTLPILKALDSSRHAELLARLAGTQARYMLDGGHEGWLIHEGDLAVDASLDLDTRLIVAGNLRIAGSLDDGHGDGHLIVLGNLALEHAFSWGTLYVAGDLAADGILFAVYNDFTFEVSGKVDAVGLVINDKFNDYRAGNLAFVLNDGDLPSDAATASAGIALRLLQPDLLTDPNSLDLDEYSTIASLMPDFDLSRARVREGKSLLRAQKAPAQLADQAAAAIAADTPVETLRTLIGGDVLLAQLVAARPMVPKALHADLLAIDDPVVQRWMAIVAPQASLSQRNAKLTPEVAATLAADPQTTQATIEQIASDPSAAIRITLAARDPLSPALRERLANDPDPGVRSAFIDDRLSDETRAKRVADPDLGVRRAVAALSLDASQTRTLLGDTDIELRIGVSRSLRAQAEHRALRRLDDTERAELATMLLAGDDAGTGAKDYQLRELATNALLALPAAQQSARFDELLARIDVDVVAEHTPSDAVMERIVALARERSQPIPEKLGRNLRLGDALQKSIVDAAEAFDPSRAAVDDFAATPDDALEELLYNDAATQIISEERFMQITRLVLRRGISPADGGMQNAYFHYHGFSAAAIDAVGAKLGADEDWALTVVLQPAATRAQLVAALARWYDDEEVVAELARLRALDDAAFWPALARAGSGDLREAAARSLHAPGEILPALLDDSDDDARFAACANPRLPQAAAIQQARASNSCIFGNPALPLEVLQEIAATAQRREVRNTAWDALSFRRRLAN